MRRQPRQNGKRAARQALFAVYVGQGERNRTAGTPTQGPALKQVQSDSSDGRRRCPESHRDRVYTPGWRCAFFTIPASSSPPWHRERLGHRLMGTGPHQAFYYDLGARINSPHTQSEHNDICDSSDRSSGPEGARLQSFRAPGGSPRWKGGGMHASTSRTCPRVHERRPPSNVAR